MGSIRFIVGAALAAVLWHGAALVRAADDAERTQAVLQVLRALRGGGHVLVVTHGAVTDGERDDPTARADDCARQQALSDFGRLAASGLGKLLGRLQVPVDSIVSSDYCRAVEVAQRIADGTRTRHLSKLDALNESAAVPPAVAHARAMALSNLVSARPAARSNLLLVTHRSNVSQAFNVDASAVGDGELWVFKPLPGTSPPGRPNGEHRRAQPEVTSVSHQLVERVRLSELSAAMHSLNARAASASTAP
jgi:phosphohistidine phosphatase SixA